RIIESLNIDAETMRHIEENDINKVEEQMDDDAESIITNERYIYIAKLMNRFYNKKNAGKLTASDKIDRVVTNRFLALPIFAIIMFLVYYISVSTLGTVLTDWANDGLFGDGWHLFGIGNSAYEEDMDAYAEEHIFTPEAMRIVEAATAADVVGAEDVLGAMEDGSFGDFEEVYDAYADSLAEEGYDLAPIVEPALEAEDVPDTSEYGVWITGIPVILEQGLEAISSAEWLNSLILDGIIGGVGAVLGFVPQMIILFIILAFLEGCGYMARAAFVLDRVFRKFGLSGKSFIPMLIGTGCSVPGIMASRTIENERDRRMTIMTTSFIPCGAKLPIIAMIATALFNGEWWVAPSAYFVGITAVIISGIMLKKTNMFAGEPAPFVMEMPPYHWPRFSNVMRSMWERASSFIKRAGTIILLASIIIWAGSSFGTVDGQFMFSTELELEHSVLGMIGGAVAWIFSPLGFGNIKATVATVMGLVAKEEVVAVFGVLDFEGLTQLAAYSFLVFNLLCAPCFAAIGAIRREMNNRKWTWFAIGYQTLFAYAISLIVYQFGLAFTGQIQILGFVIAVLLLIFLLYMLFKPYKEATKFTKRAPNLS
ncbi:MAG: ferrous iron transporter B, partial [Clostridiaceae bacterium]|nr:ferrous iron transporter B [Clostridiaceae bacterium]